ncbi:MAG: mechanosensitive ion channel [Verrucomicrobiae bacterium]|nr:mechanosensitive ion channel [Verrucomicrobiae bacterium]
MEDFYSWMLNHTFLGVPLLHFAKFLGFLAAAYVLGRLLRFPLSKWMERLMPGEDRQASERVAQGFERATFILVFSIVLKFGAIDVLHLPGWLWARCQQGMTAFMAVAATLLFLQIVDVVLLGWRKHWQDEKSQADEHLISFTRKGIRVVVVLLAVLITAENIGVEVKGLITGLGVGGAAVALAAQGLIGNLLGTFEIVGGRLFKLGDRIQFDGHDGFVQEIGLRSTKVRALSGEVVVTPNKKMAEMQIRNFSRDGTVRTSVVVGVVYSTMHDAILRAMRILEEILKARQDVVSHQIYLKNLGASSVDLETVFWARYAADAEHNKLIGELNLEIKRRFDAERIEFAFPTQTLHVFKGAEG